MTFKNTGNKVTFIGGAEEVSNFVEKSNFSSTAIQGKMVKTLSGENVNLTYSAPSTKLNSVNATYAPNEVTTKGPSIT